MTTKEKIKAFIEENAKYKVGQKVYFMKGGKPRYARVTGVTIDMCYGDFVYRGGPFSSVLAPESATYRSFEELRDTHCAGLMNEYNDWVKMAECDAKSADNEYGDE